MGRFGAEAEAREETLPVGLGEFAWLVLTTGSVGLQIIQRLVCTQNSSLCSFQKMRQKRGERHIPVLDFASKFLSHRDHCHEIWMSH